MTTGTPRDLELRDQWQQLDFWAEAARSAAEWAVQHEGAANLHALNTWSAVGSARLTRALVAWRTGLIDPTADLELAVAASESAVRFMTERQVGAHRGRFDGIPGAFCAILLDRRQSPAVDAGIREMDDVGAWRKPKGRKALPWLISELVGKGSGDGPRFAAELAATKSSGRWGRALSVYFELARCTGDAAAVVELTSQSIAMFGERHRRNEFSAPYFGSQDMNGFIVDFVLAAIWQVKGWDPQALPEDQRVFVSRDPRYTVAEGPAT
jgi:hypothetical protein